MNSTTSVGKNYGSCWRPVTNDGRSWTRMEAVMVIVIVIVIVGFPAAADEEIESGSAADVVHLRPKQRLVAPERRK